MSDKKVHFVIYVLLLIYVTHINAKNVILILADDLDVVLDGMTPLINAARLIGNQGATYANSFVASPICCPNRASILTGKYVHNHFTFNNTIEGGCNSKSWQSGLEKETFANHLKTKMNYKTFYAGKYLNKYGSREVGGVSYKPPGWDWWAGLVGNSKYYNYSLSLNGTEKKYGTKYDDYLTDVITNMAINFINIQSKKNPFLMVLAPPAPHAPFIPANRHHDKFKGTKAKRTKNFNNLSKKDKHWLVRMGPTQLPDDVITTMDNIYRKRWETLLSVDELISKTYRALERKNLLNDTYIIFTSDNGYHIGQFGLTIDKRQPYETDIKVPLLMRGPGIVPTKVNAPVSSVDIFSTILDIAGLEYPSDGISLLNNLPNDRTVLIEYHGEKSNEKPKLGCPSDNDPNLSYCTNELACKCQDAANNTFNCVRRVSEHFNNIFCSFADTQHYVEAYNLNDDNEQINNIGYTMKRGLRHRFRNRLRKMIRCKDDKCIYAGTQK